MAGPNDFVNVNPQLNLVASMHMLTAYDKRDTWSCQCVACQDIRQTPELVEAFWRAIKKQPPKSEQES